MTTFQRARRPEQREARRQAILDTAAQMLAEMPVGDISLNELSRRVGLAKSNVLRYFETREAVFLELLDITWREWLDELASELASGSADPAEGGAGLAVGGAGEGAGLAVGGAGEGAGLAVGGAGEGAVGGAGEGEAPERVAATIARSLSGRPLLCELMSTMASVLERNISADVAIRFKLAAMEVNTALAELIRAHVPELDSEAATKFVGGAFVVVAGLWPLANPSPSVLAACAKHPALAAAAHLEFGPTLEEMLTVLLRGLIWRG